MSVTTGGPAASEPRTRAQIIDYLGSFDLFKGNEWEGNMYVNEAIGRFLITVKLLPPAPRPGARLLELGANPYFITLLLKRYHQYDLTLANFFGRDDIPPEGEQTITSARYGETHRFRYQHFNIESAAFPYPDASFDVVLFCEILEHLTIDPTHVLNEIHRVLRPGGLVMVTTPNMLRWEHVRDLALGKNINDPYSGYGVYGRHNREYAPQEVIRLLEECGFSVRQARLADVHEGRWANRLLGSVRAHWREHMFILAAADRPRRYRYGPWLYRSMVGPRRFVKSSVTVGLDDEAHVGAGWHPPEAIYTDMRWTQQEALTYLRAVGGENAVEVELSTGPAQLGPVQVTLRVGEHSRTFTPPRDEWCRLRLELPALAAGQDVELAIGVDALRSPRLLGFNDDPRDLGVLVRRIALSAEAEGA